MSRDSGVFRCIGLVFFPDPPFSKLAKEYLTNKPKCLHDSAYCEVCVNSLSDFIQVIKDTNFPRYHQWGEEIEEVAEKVGLDSFFATDGNSTSRLVLGVDFDELCEENENLTRKKIYAKGFSLVQKKLVKINKLLGTSYLPESIIYDELHWVSF